MERDPAVRRAVVVYESMFGNTEAVARAVAEGLSSRIDDVEVVAVTSAPTTLDGFDLVVVGGPTHAFGMSRPATRTSARDQGAEGPTDIGVREWLETVIRPESPTLAACFDTRIRVPLLVGSAARAVRRRLRRLGFEVVTIGRFRVTATPGPLAGGELDRARRWGAGLVPATVPVAAP